MIGQLGSFGFGVFKTALAATTIESIEIVYTGATVPAVDHTSRITATTHSTATTPRHELNWEQ